MTDSHAANRTLRVFQLLLLATATWAVTYARVALGPLQEAMRIDLALSDNQIAWLQGPAVGVPMVLAAIPLGVLVDRYSRARLFVIFVTLALAGTALSAWASNFTMLFAARCLAGLAVPAVLVAAYSMVGDLYAPAQRGRATMVVAMGEIAGGPAAFALGGTLLAIATADLDNWRWALMRMCGPLLLAAILMLALREPPRTGIVVKNPPLREIWPEFWRYRRVVLPLLLARVMGWIADGAVMVWAVPSFSRSFALPPARISTMMATAMLIGGLLGPVLGGPLADFCQRSGGSRRTVAAMVVLALLSAPVALFALMPGYLFACIMLTIFLILSNTFGVAALTLSTIVISGELRGLNLAVSVTVGALASIGVAPLVVSGLSTALGGQAMLGEALAIVCAGTSILGAAVFAVARRYFPRGAVG